MINSNDIQVILEDSSFQEAMTELTKLNMDIIANSDVEDKEIREISHHLVTSVITNCIRANLMAD